MTDAVIDVLIVGAGPTGLTLACELAVRGLSFRIIEAQPDPQAGSRGKGLQPRTLEVFYSMGIVDRVLALGTLGCPSFRSGWTVAGQSVRPPLPQRRTHPTLPR